MENASREFTKDYDWPDELVRVFNNEMRQISLQTMNWKAFALNGQYRNVEQSAQGIQDACERIREAARPYTLGF